MAVDEDSYQNIEVELHCIRQYGRWDRYFTHVRHMEVTKSRVLANCCFVKVREPAYLKMIEFHHLSRVFAEFK